MKTKIIALIALLGSLIGCSTDNQEELMNSPDIYFVWFSEKQHEVQEYHNLAILKDSTIVLYTEMTRVKRPSGVWEDYVYLGRGNWHKSISRRF